MEKFNLVDQGAQELNLTKKEANSVIQNYKDLSLVPISNKLMATAIITVGPYTLISQQVVCSMLVAD